MDFALTEEQQMFQAMVRDFATKELQPLAAQFDEEEKFPADTVRKMAELGLMGVGAVGVEQEQSVDDRAAARRADHGGHDGQGEAALKRGHGRGSRWAGRRPPTHVGGPLSAVSAGIGRAGRAD